MQPFVAGLCADQTTLLAAGYLHDPSHGDGAALGLPALVAEGPVDDTVVVAGTARTDGFPVPEVVRLSRTLGSVEAATYLGYPGTRDEVAAGRVLDDGSVALVGETGYLFPTRPSSFQPDSIGGWEGFAAILSRDLRAAPPCPHDGDVDADGHITAGDAQGVHAASLGAGSCADALPPR